MFGENPIRPPVKGDGMQLDVQHIFRTVQGEGPFAGVPSVFVRLGGCNLACGFCDTEFETFENLTLEAILHEVGKLSEGAKLIVVTGGEPLRQPIRPLCEALLAAGYAIQIETNGTLFRDLPEEVSIVCSPKSVNGRYAPVRDDLLERANALKFIVSQRNDAYKAVAEVGQSVYGTPVYVQPMDEYEEAANAENISLAASLAATHGYRLCLQTHKILGVE
ncbi:MAG: 7-carboxy-7-deazaguanine synthase QueE [Alphaproteobacteria bacterium]|nr:7-carboxy-7-deazaguanine synthase QueE [Alphaproteobacteria bacterium]